MMRGLPYYYSQARRDIAKARHHVTTKNKIFDDPNNLAMILAKG
jgi:hypothetical protein